MSNSKSTKWVEILGIYYACSLDDKHYTHPRGGTTKYCILGSNQCHCNTKTNVRRVAWSNTMKQSIMMWGVNQDVLDIIERSNICCTCFILQTMSTCSPTQMPSDDGMDPCIPGATYNDNQVQIKHVCKYGWVNL